MPQIANATCASTNQQIDRRAAELLRLHQQSIYVQTDRLFAGLMLCQWFVGVLVAIWVSPQTWAGQYSDVHIHVWTALFLGGIITAWPVSMVILKPGQPVTRHSVAIGQMLYSALLIHLTGGRIESHFHIFGSLAFLGFYRDWTVLITASSVIAADHLLRGMFLPQSVYGVNFMEPWRWIEHAWWVIFEDIFLIYACRRNVREMQVIAKRDAEREAANAKTEEQVVLRTAELQRTKQRLSMQYAVASVLTEDLPANDAVRRSMEAIIGYLSLYGNEICACHWAIDEAAGEMRYKQSIQTTYDDRFASFVEASQKGEFTFGSVLPNRVLAEQSFVYMNDTSTDPNCPRREAAKQCNLRTGFGFPLMDSDKVLGELEFFFDGLPFCLAEEESESLLAIGKQIGQFIARKKLEAERERLANVVQHSNDAIFTVSMDGVITSWNRGAERLFGYSEEEAKGRQRTDLIPFCNSADEVSFTENLNLKTPIESLDTQLFKSQNIPVDVSLSLSSILDDAGIQTGWSIAMRDITERKEAERRVSEFYSIVSHELRTPLTSIRGALGLIEGDIVPIDSSEARELIEVARGSSDRLIRLINDMLDLKKIEAGKMELQKANFDAKDLVFGVLMSLTGMAEESGVALVDKSQDIGSVHADWDRATQILTNLVSNAVKFSPRGSKVDVLTELVGDRVRFSVVDRGPGISDENAKKLFEKFQQVDSSDTRQKGGTGLGLAICKALTEEHGGEIGLDSIPGQGSTFWFTLPNLSESELKPEIGATAPEVYGVSGTLLLVEDDDHLAKVMDKYLRADGYHVERASTLEGAKFLLETMSVDAVLLDINLPDGSGLNLLEEMKASGKICNIPVIVVTGEPRPDGLTGSATVIDWLCKPLNLNDLADSIERALTRVRSCKVLVVDDDSDTRRVVIAQMRALGLECMEARDGYEALSLTRAESPDLIVLDVVMPEVDGFKVVDVLRQVDAKSTPLIIYTGKDLSSMERSQLALGVTRYLTKGSDGPRDLLKAVRELISNFSPTLIMPNVQEIPFSSTTSNGNG